MHIIILKFIQCIENVCQIVTNYVFIDTSTNNNIIIKETKSFCITADLFWKLKYLYMKYVNAYGIHSLFRIKKL